MNISSLLQMPLPQRTLGVPSNTKTLQSQFIGYLRQTTIAILEKRYETNRLTRSDMLLFHTKKDLKKDFLKRIKEKEFSTQ